MATRTLIKPTYETDERAMGLAVALAIHAIFAGPFVYRAIVPAPVVEDEKPLVGKPIVAATLLKPVRRSNRRGGRG